MSTLYKNLIGTSVVYNSAKLNSKERKTTRQMLNSEKESVLEELDRKLPLPIRIRLIAEMWLYYSRQPYFNEIKICFMLGGSAPLAKLINPFIHDNNADKRGGFLYKQLETKEYLPDRRVLLTILKYYLKNNPIKKKLFVDVLNKNEQLKCF